MDEKIKLQVNKMIVHKRIHEYLKDYKAKQPVKVEVKQQHASSSSVQPNKRMELEHEPGEVKEENLEGGNQ